MCEEFFRFESVETGILYDLPYEINKAKRDDKKYGCIKNMYIGYDQEEYSYDELIDITKFLRANVQYFEEILWEVFINENKNVSKLVIREVYPDYVSFVVAKGIEFVDDEDAKNKTLEYLKTNKEYKITKNNYIYKGDNNE